MAVIGLIGERKTGKDTTAKLLMQLPEYSDYKVFAFADQVKILSRNIYPWCDYEKISDAEKDLPLAGSPYGNTPREVWKHIGKSIRQLDDLYFVKCFNSFVAQHENVIVTDIRQGIEIDVVRKQPKSKIIKIIRETGYPPCEYELFVRCYSGQDYTHHNAKSDYKLDENLLNFLKKG